ncbi:MAG TPA: pyridoxamine 5'-phosphate oxidase family protein [Actinomycetota bacterium]|nr:pyridoxamine 5'-phosphate oxidase family protein [Actinomycetota bacterium]
MSADAVPSTFQPTERTRVHRHPERGTHDREVVERTLDEALFCHVGYVVDGSPRVLPTIHVRVHDTIYIHGSSASHMLRAIRGGAEVCLVATILDGLVLARSAFNHSMNYRSAVVFGPAREVTDPDEKWMAQRALVEHVCPGRAEQARMPDERELAQTSILAIPLREASAKVRTGPPKDDEEDLSLPVWAGVLPLRTTAGEPIDAPDLAPGIAPPANVTGYRRPPAGS